MVDVIARARLQPFQACGGRAPALPFAYIHFIRPANRVCPSSHQRRRRRLLGILIDSSLGVDCSMLCSMSPIPAPAPVTRHLSPQADCFHLATRARRRTVRQGAGSPRAQHTSAAAYSAEPEPLAEVGGWEWLERSELMIGMEGMQKLRDAHVLVVGLGGVGSWCAEFLARSGVGSLTLMDGDCVDSSNRNRQLLALSSTIGQSKAHVRLLPS